MNIFSSENTSYMEFYYEHLHNKKFLLQYALTVNEQSNNFIYVANLEYFEQ